MQYSIWNKTENPIGIVQFIHDSDWPATHYYDFIKHLNENRYIVCDSDIKNAHDLTNMPHNLPVFLIGVGRGGKIVQKISCRNKKYTGAISVMAHGTMLNIFESIFPHRDTAPQIPLMIIGGWSALRQINAYSAINGHDECDIKNINLLIYPEICPRTAFNIAQNDIISFMNSAQKSRY